MNQLILRVAKRSMIPIAESHIQQSSEIPDPCKDRGLGRATASLAERQFLCIHSGGSSLYVISLYLQMHIGYIMFCRAPRMIQELFCPGTIT